jgi:hypothetical protein
MNSECLDRRDRSGFAWLSGVARLAVALTRQPLQQGFALGDAQGRVERYVDVGELQWLSGCTLCGHVDFAQLEAGQIEDERVQVECDDGFRLLRIFAALDDLRHLLDEVAADEMPVADLYRAVDSGAALGRDIGARIQGTGEVTLPPGTALAERLAVALSDRARAVQARLLCSLQLRDPPPERLDVVRVVGTIWMTRTDAEGPARTRPATT